MVIRLMLAACLLSVSAVPAHAVDLTKIERRIVKEPAYQGQPKYLLIVFGPEAAFRVWLVLDGHTLYVDRNGNGDLTEAGERVAAKYVLAKKPGHFGFAPGKLGPPDSPAKYHLSQLRIKPENCDMSMDLTGRSYARAGYDGPGHLQFAECAAEAAIVHFFGPLTFQRFDPQPGSVCETLTPAPLVRGQKNLLAFSVGTPGLGSGAFAKSDYEIVPQATVEIRFANGKTVTAELKPDG